MGIKSARESMGLTQKELADYLGVTRSSVAMWETRRALPRADTLVNLARILNTSLDELMKKDESD